jgi:hypothetical protein
MHLERASSNVPEIAELDGDLKKNGPLPNRPSLGSSARPEGVPSTSPPTERCSRRGMYLWPHQSVCQHHPQPKLTQTHSQAQPTHTHATHVCMTQLHLAVPGPTERARERASMPRTVVVVFDVDERRWVARRIYHGDLKRVTARCSVPPGPILGLDHEKHRQAPRALLKEPWPEGEALQGLGVDEVRKLDLWPRKTSR